MAYIKWTDYRYPSGYTTLVFNLVFKSIIFMCTCSIDNVDIITAGLFLY